MKKRFTLLVLATVAFHLTAFPQAFIKRYVPVGSNVNLTFSCIAKVPSISHYYVSGIQDKRLFIQEVDFNGTVIQQKRLNVSSNLYTIASMIVDDDGNILLVGSYSLASSPYNGWLIKLSPTFTQLFHTTYFDSNPSNWLALTNVKDYRIGGVYYLCGQTRSLSTSEDALILKVDRSTGTVISSGFDGAPTTSATSDTYYTLYVDKNGVVAASRLSTGAIGTFRPYLAKHSLTTLAFKKSKRYISNPASVNARLYGDDIILDGTNFIFTGSGDKGGTNLSNRVYLLSADSSTLNPNWEYEYKLTSNNAAPYPYFDQVLSESSGYVMSGHWYDGIDSKELFLMKTDKNGIPQWCEQFKAVYSVNLNHFTTEVIDQGYVFTVGYEIVGGQRRGIIIKVPVATGTIDSACVKILSVTSKSKTYSKKETVVPNSTTYTVGSQTDPLSSLDLSDFVKCGGPCVNDTINLLDVMICAGKSFTICNQAFTIPGQYSVTCTGADGCQHTYLFYLYTSSLTANAGPDAGVGGCCAITLNGSAIGGSPGYTYSWSPTTGLSNPNIPNPSCTTPNTYTLTVTDAAGCTSTDVVVISSGGFSCCRTGFNEDVNRTTVNIFPNPSSDGFTLTWGNLEISEIFIYNIVGQLVKSFDHLKSGFEFGKDLPEGTYQVSLTYVNGESEQLQLIKISR